MGSWLEWVWVPLAVAVGSGVVLLVIEYRTGWFARRGSSGRGGAEEGGRAVEGEEAGGGRRMGRRKRIPEETVAELVVRSRRRCCLCYGLEGDLSEKEGQIAHLDGDPSNNDVENLAFLCFRHHNRYDSRTRQSKGLTMGEVKRYRDELYQALEAGGRGGGGAPGGGAGGAAGVTEVRETVQIGNPIIRLLRGVRLWRVLQVGGGRIEVTEGGHPDDEEDTGA